MGRRTAISLNMLDRFLVIKAWSHVLAIIRAHGCDGLIYLMLGNSKTKSGAPVARRT
jgi:hypothetical protein